MKNQLRWTVLLATTVGCAVSLVWLAIAQSAPTPSQTPSIPQQRATVKGFEDVINAQLDSEKKKLQRDSSFESLNAESIAASHSQNKEVWLRVIKAFGLNPPSRPEGWKFANHAWLRWRGILSSRAGGIGRFRMLMMIATAYCPHSCCGSSHGRTATGRRAEYGVVAVDPRVIPLGTFLYVDRYGFAIAADTGRKIKGNRIDLCFPTHREAMRYGRRKVKVLILR